MVIITADNLRRLGTACGAVEIFEREWFNAVEVTVENALRALEFGLCLDWYIRHALPQKIAKAYLKATAPAGEAYSKARAAPWDIYLKASAPHSEAYEKAGKTAVAWKAYLEARAPVGEALIKAMKAMVSVTEAYRKTIAEAFVEACLQNRRLEKGA